MTPEEAVDAIVQDLTCRRGLRHEWDNIDEEVEAEIKNEWLVSVKEAVEAERSRCMADVCGGCKDGAPVRYEEHGRYWCHYNDGGASWGCTASTIRARMEKDSEE